MVLGEDKVKRNIGTDRAIKAAARIWRKGTIVKGRQSLRTQKILKVRPHCNSKVSRKARNTLATVESYHPIAGRKSENRSFTEGQRLAANRGEDWTVWRAQRDWSNHRRSKRSESC